MLEEHKGDHYGELQESKTKQVCIQLSISPPVGGSTIKGFGDGEKNQKLEKKEKKLKILHFFCT